MAIQGQSAAVQLDPECSVVLDHGGTVTQQGHEMRRVKKCPATACFRSCFYTLGLLEPDSGKGQEIVKSVCLPEVDISIVTVARSFPGQLDLHCLDPWSLTDSRVLCTHTDVSLIAMSDVLVLDFGSADPLTSSAHCRVPSAWCCTYLHVITVQRSEQAGVDVGELSYRPQQTWKHKIQTLQKPSSANTLFGDVCHLSDKVDNFVSGCLC